MDFNISKSDLEVLNRAITGIVYNRFGGVCMEVLVHREKDEDIITLNVWDKPMADINKKLVISEEFVYESLHGTVSRIERFVIDKS